MNIELTSSNACRNARILSIEIIFSLMKSGKLVDFIKRKKMFGVSGTLNAIKRTQLLTEHNTGDEDVQYLRIDQHDSGKC